MNVLGNNPITLDINGFSDFVLRFMTDFRNQINNDQRRALTSQINGLLDHIKDRNENDMVIIIWFR